MPKYTVKLYLEIFIWKLDLEIPSYFIYNIHSIACYTKTSQRLMSTLVHVCVGLYFST